MPNTILLLMGFKLRGSVNLEEKRLKLIEAFADVLLKWLCVYFLS